jgi:hypothetical protein
VVAGEDDDEELEPVNLARVYVCRRRPEVEVGRGAADGQRLERLS